MVGDCDVGETASDGGADHLAERVLTVGGVGVHVEVAADVSEFHEHGEFASFRKVDLVTPLAKLRRNPGQSDRLVDFRLGPAG